ncbi:MAG: hypothetical protein KAS04_04525 [Candidatus Aenigmarchaeota archaeon]|nr:hypothetical protein [Candidatus Aenigmarchaeota archaeon]
MTKKDKKVEKSAKKDKPVAKAKASATLVITRIAYEQKRSDGNYGSVGATVEVSLGKKDRIEDAWILAESEVEKQIAKRLKDAENEPRIGKTKSAPAARTSVPATPAAPKLPRNLSDEDMETFMEEHADAVYAKAVGIFGEEEAEGNARSAAIILAREMGLTGVALPTINTLKLDQKGFDIKVEIAKIFEPKIYTRKDGGEGSRQSVLFKDDTGQIYTTLFDKGREILEQFGNGDIVMLKSVFLVTEYNGKLQLNLGKFCNVEMVKKADKQEELYPL